MLQLSGWSGDQPRQRAPFIPLVGETPTSTASIVPIRLRNLKKNYRLYACRYAYEK